MSVTQEEALQVMLAVVIETVGGEVRIPQDKMDTDFTGKRLDISPDPENGDWVFRVIDDE
jgi:hypothetical protein